MQLRTELTEHAHLDKQERVTDQVLGCRVFTDFGRENSEGPSPSPELSLQPSPLVFPVPLSCFNISP